MIRSGNAIRYIGTLLLRLPQSRRKYGRGAPSPRPPVSRLAARLKHLAAFIHAGLQVDVMRAAQFAGILVLDIARLLERVGGATHSAPGRCGFSFRDGHYRSPGGDGSARDVWKAVLIKDRPCSC